MLENIENTITRLAMDQFWRNLGGRIPSRSRHVCHNSVAMATAVALDFQQLSASWGRTHEPILMKFGIQQQIRTTKTVTWSNIKIFKIQNGGRPLFEIIRKKIEMP